MEAIPNFWSLILLAVCAIGILLLMPLLFQEKLRVKSTKDFNFRYFAINAGFYILAIAAVFTIESTYFEDAGFWEGLLIPIGIVLLYVWIIRIGFMIFYSRK